VTRIALLGLALAAASWPVVAQTTAPRPAAAAAERAEQIATERAERARELAAIEADLSRNQAARARLAAEIATIRSDGPQLAAGLVDTAARLQASEERAATIEDRLRLLSDSQGAIRRSLVARRGTLTEVLAALQRTGRLNAPTFLVRIDDVLAAVRSAVLLGAVLPELRAETQSLAVDLAELSRLHDEIARERDLLTGERTRLVADKLRLDALVEARQARLALAEADVGSERRQAETLAGEARSLRELVDRLGRDIAAAQDTADRARRTAEGQARQAQDRFAALGNRDPARLAPRLPFASARGTLPLPAGGTVRRAFGAADGAGDTMRGVAFAVRPGALVTAPTDGAIVFTGPFRSYGQLLILDAGGGYHLVLVGMDRISVEPGQFVLAGEPVGQVGVIETTSEPRPAAVGVVEGSGPVLYVELRKDGTPIDPSPWWAKSQGEKVRG
jgi:septal ring factor EnvC (AmiA/AmiB activator)